MNTPNPAQLLGQLDQLARQSSPMHRLDPRAKLLVLVVFLLCVVSYDQYQCMALLPFFIVPIVWAQLGRIPLRFILRRLIWLSPFPLMIGLFNPWLDTQPMLLTDTVEINAGWFSYASIVLRFWLTLGALMVMIALSSFDGLCLALQRLGLPALFVSQLSLLYRYLFVLLDELQLILTARQLRSFGRRGFELAPYTSLLGQWLLRTLKRSQAIHQAMRCRGFTGMIQGARPLQWRYQDSLFCAISLGVLLLLRFVDIPWFFQHLLSGVV